MRLRGALLLGMLVTPAAASAQRVSAGEARFNQARTRGQRLHVAGRHEEALRVFLGARTSFAGTNTELMMLMAQEQIEVGLVAEGVRNAVECVARTETDVANPRAPALRRQCLQLLEAVRANLYSTTAAVRVGAVQVDAAAEAHPDLVVRVGGLEIPRSLWGQPIPVLEGRSTIQLEAPDAGVIRRDVRITAARRQRLVVGATTSAPVTVEDAPILQVEAPRSTPPRAAAPTPLDAGYGEVVLRVVDPPEGMGVAVGGFDLPRVWWGHPFPVRPGVVQVDADAQGHVRGRRRVTVAAGRRVEVEMQLQRLPAEPPEEAPAARSERRTPWLAVTMLGLGVGAVATGGVMFGLARDRQDTLDAPGSCTGIVPRTECVLALQPLAEEGATMTTAGNALTIGGGVLAVTGAIWWIVSATRDPEATEPPTETARMSQRVWGGRVP